MVSFIQRCFRIHLAVAHKGDIFVYFTFARVMYANLECSKLNEESSQLKEADELSGIARNSLRR